MDLFEMANMRNFFILQATVLKFDDLLAGWKLTNKISAQYLKNYAR